jgi:hypothetical protein
MVVELNPKQLFNQAIRQNVPFHYLYKWAEHRIRQIAEE